MRKKMFLGAGHLIFRNARKLRKNMTHAETLLWSYLVRRPFGYKFRRQHPISIFIADFYCHALKLVIEVDGSIHDSNEAKEQDASRQHILEAEGIRFLRFTNEAVEKHLETVIKEIENYVIKNTSTT